MKALSLTQPWATLVVTGEKEIETRSWRTNHHGMIAIHASKGFPAWARGETHHPVFREAIRRHGYDSAPDLPLGAIIGVVSIMGCVKTEEVRPRLRGYEEMFGDYTDGRFAWYLNEPQMIEPIPFRGALGLWEVPLETSREILIRIGLRDKPFAGAGRGDNDRPQETAVSSST
jgi:hypothetical protein